MSGERSAAGAAGISPPAVEGSAAGTWVLVERAGSLWGVAGETVVRLAPGGRLLVRGEAGGPAAGELTADRVVAVVSGLAVRPAPRSLARWWGEPVAGLAVYGERPVVLVDPARLPAPLAAGTGRGGAAGPDGGGDDAGR